VGTKHLPPRLKTYGKKEGGAFGKGGKKTFLAKQRCEFAVYVLEKNKLISSRRDRKRGGGKEREKKGHNRKVSLQYSTLNIVPFQGGKAGKKEKKRPRTREEKKKNVFTTTTQRYAVRQSRNRMAGKREETPRDAEMVDARGGD